MASSLRIDQRTFKGISNVIVVQNSTNDVMALPTATGFVIDSGRSEREIMTSNQLGEMAFSNSFNSAVNPSLQLTYGVYNAEMYAIQENVRLETGLLTVKIPYKFWIPKTGVHNPVATGRFLYQITEDAVSYASIVKDKKSYQLTQMPYTGFDDSVDDTFAVGDHGEFIFSTNLYNVTDPPYVNIETEAEISGNYLGSEPIGDMRISATLVDSNNMITYVQVYRAIVNTGGITFDPKAEGITLNLRLASDGCRAFQYLDTQDLVSC